MSFQEIMALVIAVAVFGALFGSVLYLDLRTRPWLHAKAKVARFKDMLHYADDEWITRRFSNGATPESIQAWTLISDHPDPKIRDWMRACMLEMVKVRLERIEN